MVNFIWQPEIACTSRNKMKKPFLHLKNGLDNGKGIIT